MATDRAAERPQILPKRRVYNWAKRRQEGRLTKFQTYADVIYEFPRGREAIILPEWDPSSREEDSGVREMERGRERGGNLAEI